MVGPVFTREVATAPRSWQLYFSRALYVGALFGLVCTAWLILFGSQPVRTLGDLSRFGAAVFGLIAPVQLALAAAFSALLTAAAVAQEKDRGTFDLLLMTNLSNTELVLGRLLASMLTVLVLMAAAVPLLMLIVLLGGVSHPQVARVFGVTLATAVASGSIGSTVALWREKTFQSLAMTALALVMWLLVGEAMAAGVFGATWQGFPAETWAEAVSPLRAMLAAVRPDVGTEPLLAMAPWAGGPVRLFILLAGGGAFVLNLIAIFRVRAWNPTRELRVQPVIEENANDAISRNIHAAPGGAREVWDNPILWREIRTWAYGKKVVLVRIAYLAIFAACAWASVAAMGANDSATPEGEFAAAAAPLVPLLVLGMVLVNALAVTSLTNERDAKALDLLLVTDLTPKEIIFGKLGGIAYNAKEVVLLPIALCVGFWVVGRLSTENAMLLFATLATLNAYVAMLGVHSGMTYANSRTAVAVSLGTVLFLLLGVAVCMRMMVAFQTEMYYQLVAFLAFMVGGGVALFFAMGARNRSQAIVIASGLSPFATFYAIATFLKHSYGAASLVTILMYSFATAAMLIPAIHEFDVATGRTLAKDV